MQLLTLHKSNHLPFIIFIIKWIIHAFYWSFYWRHLFEKDWQHISCRHLLSILSRAERYSKDKYCNLLTVTQGFYYWRHKNAWIGSRKFCNQIARKQLLMNTKVREHPLYAEQKERGMTGDFLTLVTKDQRHEYLTCCYQMKSVKVWQLSLKLDEQSFFFLQSRLSSNDSYSQYYIYHPDHFKWSCDCLDMRTPISPNIKSTFQWVSYIVDLNNGSFETAQLGPLLPSSHSQKASLHWYLGVVFLYLKK